MVELGGLTGKKIYIVNLWVGKRTLPQSIPEVLARRDEIFLAEKIRRNIRGWESIDNYRRLVEEIMGHLEPKTAEQIRRRPHYIETRAKGWPALDHPHHAGARDGRVAVARLRILAQDHRGAHRARLRRRQKGVGARGGRAGEYGRGSSLFRAIARRGRTFWASSPPPACSQQSMLSGRLQPTAESAIWLKPPRALSLLWAWDSHNFSAQPLTKISLGLFSGPSCKLTRRNPTGVQGGDCTRAVRGITCDRVASAFS